jgi:hypothetical protein
VVIGLLLGFVIVFLCVRKCYRFADEAGVSRPWVYLWAVVGLAGPLGILTTVTTLDDRHSRRLAAELLPWHSLDAPDRPDLPGP